MASENISTKKTQASSPNQTAAQKKKNKKLIIILVSVAVVVFVILPTILFFMFSLWVNKAVKDSTGIDVQSGSVEIKDKNGNSFSAGSDNKKLPDGFPKNEIILYEGKRISVARSSVEGGTSWSVTIETSDKSDKVSTSVKDDLKKKGWTIESESEANSSSYIMAQKADLNAVISVMASDAGKTNVTYVISQSKE